MQDQLIALLYSFGGAVLLAGLSFSFLRRSDWGLIWLSYFAHIVAARGQIWITSNVYGSGDMFLYRAQGVAVANAVRYGSDGMLAEVIRLLFQQDAWIPVHVTGAGSSTGSMTALAALLFLICGDSMLAATTIVAILSFCGKLVMYIALGKLLHKDLHKRVLIACLLIPSVVFWSSGLLKESLAMIGMGWMMLGVQMVVSAKVVRGAIFAFIGAIPIAVMKPYVLFAFAVSAAIWYYWGRIKRGKGGMFSYPMQIGVGIAVAVGAIIVLGKYFPRFAFDNLGEQLALQQELGQTTSGGSTYIARSPSQSGIVAQLVFAPGALVASLFRPVVLEAKNPQIFINSMETTVLAALLVRVLWKERMVRLWRYVTSSPVLMFFLAFTIVFGVAVGLGTSNLGTLSRYRVPLVPFYAGLVFVLDYLVMNRRRGDMTIRNS